MNQEKDIQTETPELNPNPTPGSAPVADNNVPVNTEAPVENAPVDTQLAPVPEVEPAPVENPAPAPATPEAAPAPVESHQPKIQDEVIYKIKEEKGGNVFGVIFFFAIIFVAVFYLPKMSDELSKYIPGISRISGPTSSGQSEEPAPEKPGDKEEKKEELFDLNGFVSNAGIDDLQLGNFVKDNNSGVNELKFYVLNNGDDVFTFNDNTKFFIDLYDGENYISSVLVYSFNSIGPKESIDFSSIISSDAYKSANKFKIVRKNKSDYKPVNLVKQEGEYKILTCTLNNNTVEYLFINNYLEIINDNYEEKIGNIFYYQDLEKYRNAASTYEGIPSIDYNVIESNEGFNVKTRVELEKINDSTLKKLATYKYFSYHKDSKVVSFEMTSLGYNCS